jgi:molybdopterin molybdotransferase
MSVHDHVDRETGAALVAFEDARRRAMDHIEPLPPGPLSLREAHGCVLAADVIAPMDLPPFTSSAMDGFAVRAEDVAGASADHPVPLRVTGRVAMGRPAEDPVVPGSAVAVPTGGPIPEGADAVVPVEHVVVEGDRALVLRPPQPGRHVRPGGQDVRAGELLCAAGRRLSGAELGLLASAGHAEVPVHRRARVGILSTGDELVEPGADRPGAAIYDANAFTLYGSVLDAGAVPTALGRVADDPSAVAEALADTASRVDVLVSSGGVAVGDRDPVKAAFRDQVDFLEVAMQPGKPQAFGIVGGRPYFGLPGNPVSVFVSFEAFVRPALMRLMGRPERRPEVEAVVDGELGGPVEKVRFARVRLRREGDGWRATPAGGRQSNLLATVARAHGLAVVPRGVASLATGDRCRVWLLRDPDQP